MTKKTETPMPQTNEERVQHAINQIRNAKGGSIIISINDERLEMTRINMSDVAACTSLLSVLEQEISDNIHETGEVGIMVSVMEKFLDELKGRSILAHTFYLLIKANKEMYGSKA